MKLLITIIITLSIFTLHSQNYKLIDDKVKNYPDYDQIDQLVLRVNNSFNTDTEKVRAFYTWIAHNVTYDLDTYYSVRPPVLILVFNSEHINLSIKNQNRKKIAIQVFKDRKALCLGFSSLFTELCLMSNIEVKTIEGIVKTSVDDIENLKYSKNHSWNAVKINNEWKLLDITFSSGYENINTGKWVRLLNDFYFFTNPEILLSSHLPAQSKFQLISEPLSIEAFFKRPIFYNNYFESDLQLSDYQPGLLSASNKQQEIQIKFKDNNPNIYYKFDNELMLKKLKLKKYDIENYVATLKYKSDATKVLSLYYDNMRVLDFKVEN